MRILNEYPGKHHYFDEFEKTEYFCPQCGAKEVWQEQGAGDYYVGEDWICTACSSIWKMIGPSKITEINDMGKIAQLRQGKTFEPTTKRGG